MFKRGRWNLIGFKADRFLRDAIERGAEKRQCANISEYVRLAVRERLQIDSIRVGSENDRPDPTPLLDQLDCVEIDKIAHGVEEEVINRSAAAESVAVKPRSANGAAKPRTGRGPNKPSSADGSKAKRSSRKKGDAS